MGLDMLAIVHIVVYQIDRGNKNNKEQISEFYVVTHTNFSDVCVFFVATIN